MLRMPGCASSSFQNASEFPKLVHSLTGAKSPEREHPSQQTLLAIPVAKHFPNQQWSDTKWVSHDLPSRLRCRRQGGFHYEFFPKLLAEVSNECDIKIVANSFLCFAFQ